MSDRTSMHLRQGQKDKLEDAQRQLQVELEADLSRGEAVEELAERYLNGDLGADQ